MCMSHLRTVEDFGHAFRLMEPIGLEGYIDGGAGRGVTLERNTAAWDHIEVRPHVLAGPTQVSLATTVIGTTDAVPFMVAPMGFQRYVKSDGGVVVPRAAAAEGVRYCHSTFASSGFSDLAGIAGLRWWFQLYALKDWGLNRAMVQLAAEAGAEAVILTVDLAALGVRERDVHTGFSLRGNAHVPCVEEAGAADPRLAPTWASLDHDLSWASLAELVGFSPVPVIVKGILRPSDAAMAIDHGASAVVVSNHGGRQLDTSVPTAEVLADIVDRVDGRGSVIVDSGLRSGLDVAKALALGADSTMIGRPIMWGLGVAGEEGVGQVLRLLKEDVERSIILMGARSTSELSREFVIQRH